MSHTNEYEMASMNPEPPNHSLPPAPASEASLPPNITNTITPQESGNSTEDEFERQWAANPDFYADVRFYGSFSYLPYDYLLFKNEPFGKSFRDLICVETLRLRSSEEPIEPHLTVADKASFSECLDRLRLCLTLEEANCLRVCMITPTSTRDIHDVLSFKSKLFVSIARLAQKYDTPNQSILFTIGQAWKIPSDVIAICMESGREIRSLVPYMTFSTNKGPSNMISTSSAGWLSIQLKWQSHSPQYKTDFNTYLWEPQNTAPEYQGALMFVANEPSDSWKILISWRTKTTSPRAIQTPQYYSKVLQKHFSQWPRISSNSKAAVVALMLSIYTILIRDTQIFLDTVLRELAILTTKGRRSPSASKLNFLLHLDDCRQESATGVRDAISLLGEISTHFSLNKNAIGHEELKGCIVEISVQLNSLGDSLTEIDEAIRRARVMIKEQIDLRQISRSGVLAILAAIYLPFTFVTGMFSMLLQDPFWNTPTNGSNFTTTPSQTTTSNQTVVTTTTPITGQIAMYLGNLSLASGSTSILQGTASYTSNLSASNPLATTVVPSPHLWTIKQFLYIAFAITAVTIVMPLIASTVFRAILTSINRYKTYWRMAILIVGIPVLITLDIFLPPLILSLLVGIPQGMLALVNWSRVVQRQKKWKRWNGYITLLTACLYLDILFAKSVHDEPNALNSTGHYLVLTGILPPLYLFVILIQTDTPQVPTSKRPLSLKLPLLAAILDFIALRIQSLKDTYNDHRILCHWCMFVIGATINTVLDLTFDGYYIIPFTPFILYSIERWFIEDDLQTLTTLRRRTTWALTRIGFMAVTVFSEYFGIFGSQMMGRPFLPILGLLPTIYLIIENDWLGFQALYKIFRSRIAARETIL